MVQPELVTNETLPVTEKDPRAAAVLASPLASDFFTGEESVFKLSGKMFALSQLDADELRISLKCEPGLAEQLRDAHGESASLYALTAICSRAYTCRPELEDDRSVCSPG